jgi:excisionase family DNA binding protein
MHIAFENLAVEQILTQLNRIEQKLSKVTDLAVNNDTELLSVKQAAAKYGYGVQFIYKLLRLGRIKKYGNNRSVRISKIEIEKYLNLRED